MKRVIFLFMLFIIFYHVMHTLIGFGQGGIDPLLLSVTKDMVRMLIVVAGLWIGRGHFFLFLKRWQRPIVLMILLLAWSIVLSIYHGVAIDMMLVGLKYDIYPLLIFLSSIFLGSVLKEKKILYAYKEIPVMKLFLFILIGGIVWQGAKVIIPEFFSWWGYGPIGDYVLGTNPPMRYRTGPGGVMRLQGLFSGPNNYGFFLVSVCSLVFGLFFNKPPVSKTPTNDFVAVAPFSGGSGLFARLGLFFLFIISLVWTLSRGAWIGVGVQVFLLIWLFKPERKKYLRVLLLVGIFCLGAVAQLKSGSTLGHIIAWFEGREAFVENPWGYGLASAGPAVHWEGVYLPENHYLQLLLDIGLPGLVLWLGVVVSIFSVIKKQRGSIDQQKRVMIILFGLGLVGLLTEGFFLHVFEDSMVNYLFFVPFGLVLGNCCSSNSPNSLL